MSPGLDTPVIWQYWETPPGRHKPAYITLCQEAVRRMCASCEVIVVTPENLADYLPDLPFDLDRIRLKGNTAPAIALKADYLRIALLQRFGGMWLDSDCVPLVDLGPVMREALEAHEFYGMRKTETSGNLSNGAIASVAGGAIVSEVLRRQDEMIHRKLAANEGFRWTELGASLLGPVADQFPDTLHLEPEKHFHPLHFEESHRWWVPSDRERLADLVAPDAKLLMLFNKRSSDDQKSRTRRQVLNGSCLASQAIRRGLGIPRLETPSTPRPRYTPGDVELVFTTVHRPDSCLAFVRSIREVLGDAIHVHFAVQGAPHDAYAEAAERHGCRVSYLDENAGVSVSRNHLVEACERPIVFLCDDDFLFDERLEFQRALDVMSDRPDIGVLAGLCENFNYDESGRQVPEPVPTAFNHLLLEEPDRLDFLPAQYLDLPRIFLDETFFLQEMDTVNNFALMRPSLFSEYGLRWDPECRFSGQHELFFIDYRRLVGNRLKIFYTNLLLTQHHRRSNPAFESSRLGKNDFQRVLELLEKSEFRFPGKRQELRSEAGVQRTTDRWWRKP